ncbi:MAG: flagellar biosynthesis protein FlhB [Gammaproteobacteria bacterium]
MAESGGQEKTEEATPKRKREAREKGQVARSREFNTTIIMLVGAVGMLLMGGGLMQGLAENFRLALSIEHQQIFDDKLVLNKLYILFKQSLLFSIPFLIVVFLVTLCAPPLIGGWGFSWQALQPKLEKINPLKGIKRMFSLQALMELVKALIKFTVVLLVAIIWVWVKLDEFLRINDLPLVEAIEQTLFLSGQALLIISSSLILIALFDVPFQLWQHSSQLKMSRQELKDEYKDTEGKPEVKSQIRRLQQEMSRRRMMEEVPKADVIITNPEHYAVAIVYNKKTNGAPRVVARGTDFIAQQIRQIATQHKVIIVQAPRLARAIYYNTELNHEIPPGLYVAVAKVLVYVYQLRKRRPYTQGVVQETQLGNLEIPDDMPTGRHNNEV